MNEYEENKKNRLSTMLQRGLVQVAVDSRVPGVLLPKHLMNKTDVLLNLSHRFKHPISLAGKCVRTTLSFSGTDYPVVLPLDSIWCMDDLKGDISLCTLEMPKELLSKLTQRTPPVILQSVDGGEESSPPREGHLKLLH